MARNTWTHRTVHCGARAVPLCPCLLLFVFNFHHTQSVSDYRIGTFWGGRYKLVLDSDGGNSGGHGRIHWDVIHQTKSEPWHERSHFLQLYIPARTCQEYHCFETWEEAATNDEKVAETVATAEPEKVSEKAPAAEVTEVSKVASKLEEAVKLNGTKLEMKTK